jgi:hypothetical protein
MSITKNNTDFKTLEYFVKVLYRMFIHLKVRGRHTGAIRAVQGNMREEEEES